jgi:hypothetical protein
MYTKACLILAGLLSTAQAAPLERNNITSCAYQAGTAYEIQHIRQKEGHDWEQFAANIHKIYADSQGRDDLLVIAERVFIQPAETEAEVIHDEIFNACVQRQQGTEALF